MDDLKLIKKHYGENMMHLCRELFSTILEKEGLLFDLLSKNFDYSRELYIDIVSNDMTNSFKEFIYNQIDKKNERKVDSKKTPKELLNEAGYNLYECYSEDDIQRFKKYYSSGEELCTFNGGRLNKCHVFFAVKKNVDNIKREDFENPERQDKYGTSVISIQFSKGDINTLSIKNRYNHTVNNPDATFSNDLDNIIPGLTKSFSKYYNLKINSNNGKFELKNYVKANDGKLYKYNYETNNMYFCPNNIVIDNFEAIRYDKGRYIVFDYFILDMMEKDIYTSRVNDGFFVSLSNINNIKVNKSEDGNREIIINDEVFIIINRLNQIIEYKNYKLKKLDHGFLEKNKTLKNIDVPNVEKVENCSLTCNEALEELSLPNVKYIPSNFLPNNKVLNKLELPNVKIIDKYFLEANEKLESIYLPKVEKIYYAFLRYNEIIKNVILPNLKEIEGCFLPWNRKMEYLYLPKVEEIGDAFLYNNTNLKRIYLPKVKQIGTDFVTQINTVEEIQIPQVKKIGANFLENCEYLGNDILVLPELEIVKSCFMKWNKNIRKIYFPKLRSLRYQFLSCDKNLEEIYLPNLDDTSYNEYLEPEMQNLVDKNRYEVKRKKFKLWMI